MVELADRLIIDSAASDDAEASLQELAGTFDDEYVPPIGDLQWVALSPWRSLISDLLSSPERAWKLDEGHEMEVLYGPGGECQALLLVGWLASALGWEFEDASRDEGRWGITCSGPSGGITVNMSDGSPDARLRRVRLYIDDCSFQVSRHRELSDASATLMCDGGLIGERTAQLGSFDLGVLLGEELQYRGRGTAYEEVLKMVVGVLNRFP